jgi:cyclase
MGAGEILITSIDQEGTQKGFDLDLIKEITKSIRIPLIVSGGMGKLEDLKDLIKFEPSGIAIASVLHYNKLKIKDIKKYITKKLKKKIRNEK